MNRKGWTMSDLPKPPKTHHDFGDAFPEVAGAWEAIGSAGKKGPLDQKTCRLIKLALAMGAQQEGSVHASVRKGLAMGITKEEFEQVVILAAGTLGFPQTVAAYTWIKDLL
jgi:alkylhydroperoxidase/carboxymuconolactone decarboxylase family protein YurZ